MFTEDLVNEAITEMKQPDVKSWELFSEVANFKVYRRPVSNSPLKILYYEFRKTWDSNMVGWKALPNERLHFVARFLWPLSPRDYVYEQKVKEFKDGVIAVHGKSVQDPSAPAISGVVHVDDFRQVVVIQPTQDGQGCKAWFGYCDDPKGNIPSTILNWAAKSGIPAFLNSFKDAGHRLVKKDAEAGMTQDKAEPLTSSGQRPIAVQC